MQSAEAGRSRDSFLASPSFVFSYSGRLRILRFGDNSAFYESQCAEPSLLDPLRSPEHNSASPRKPGNDRPNNTIYSYPNTYQSI